MDDIAAYYPPPSPPPGSVHYPSYYHHPPPLPHHHQHHLVPPYYPPQPQLYASCASPQPAYDEVRTLFVAGLPEDVTAREIYNLFREFPGYESSHLRTPTKKSQPFAFAVFLDKQSAIGAMHALNTMKELAPIRKLEVHHIQGPLLILSWQLYWQFRKRDNSLKHGMNISRHNTPCPTLFVANLGPACTEQELIQVFSRCPGFIKLKMQSTYGAPVAFVDFQDTASSTGALSHLQGTVLYSSTSGDAMRFEFAKSRMGMRKKPK